MIKYVLKRLLAIIPVLIGISFIIFFILDLTPGDPARLILGQNATKEAVEELTLRMGLNDPFFVRYFRYIRDIILHFDFGTSYRTGKAVFADIMPRLPTSLGLATCGMVASLFFGVPLGILSAVKQYSAADNVTRVLAMFLVSCPLFWLAQMMILLFCVRLNWLPALGGGAFKGWVLPTITLMVANGCSVLRITRSSMLETIRADYVRTARAKGVPKGVITFKHELQNASLPIINTLGWIFGSLIGGAIVTETVFSMPGLGSLIVLSIECKDIPVVMASLILLAFFFSVIMLIVDLIFAFVDPRIKAKYQNM